MRKFPIYILVLLSVFLSVCTDGDPTPTEVVAPSFLTALAQDGEDHTLFPLADLQELVDGLKPGRCALEYHHQGRKYKRKIHNLKFPKELRGSTDWRPFHYTVLLGDSLVLNRAVCMIPAGQEGIDAMMAQSLGTWPSTVAVSDRVSATGSDLFGPVIGRSPSGEDCEEGTEWFPEAEICWPPIEMEGILVSVNQEVCEDPAEFYDHFSQGCFCFFDCGDEFVPWTDWDSNWTPDDVCDREADPDCGDGGGSGEGLPPDDDRPPEDDPTSFSVTLQCDETNVERGQPVNCEVIGETPDNTIYEWTFEPGEVRFFDTDEPAVYGDVVPGPEGAGRSDWGGKMVYPGCISVIVRPDPDFYGGEPIEEIMESCITILDRTGADWNTPLTLSQRATHDRPWGGLLIPGDSTTIGTNFHAGSDPLSGGLVRFSGTTALTAINDDGPNDGYGYIENVPYVVPREWQFNRHLSPSGPKVWDAERYDSLGFWAMTIEFGGDPSSLADAVRAHETWGGPGIGHQGMLRDALEGDQCGNVRLRLERLAGKYSIMGAVQIDVVNRAQQYLDDAIDGGHRWVGDNRTSQTVAFWNPTDQTFFSSLASGDESTGGMPAPPADCQARF